MASSFASQIPIVTFVIAKISPKHILDIGKGFGKYGLLIHEYIGINTSKKPIPNKTLKAWVSCGLPACKYRNDLFTHNRADQYTRFRKRAVKAFASSGTLFA